MDFSQLPESLRDALRLAGHEAVALAILRDFFDGTGIMPVGVKQQRPGEWILIWK